MTHVASAAVTDLNYDDARRWLFVRFTSGDWYAYFDVPPQTFHDFLAADSKGRFVQDRVRDQFAYQRMED